jgi:hypothetical protein
MKLSSEKPSQEDYRKLIETEWADFHHSRLQEWTAFGIVAGIHLGIITIFDVFGAGDPSNIAKTFLLFGPFIGIIFAVLGGLVTCRHERLKKIKLQWIGRAEYFRGLMRTNEEDEALLGDNKDVPNPRIIPFNQNLWTDIPWEGLMLPRRLSTSWLILCFYGFLILVDIGFFLYKMNA